MTIVLVLSLAAAAAVQQPDAASLPVQEVGGQESVAGSPRAVAPQTTGAGRDRMICRRQVRTGTLAGFERNCHTAAEWEAIARGGQQSWQQLQGPFGHTNDRMGRQQDLLRSGPGRSG